jgi:predicted acetyltransferase
MNNGNLQLRTLRVADEDAFRLAVEEFRRVDPEWEFAIHYNPQASFADYVRRLESWSKGQELPLRFVPNTFLVGVVGNSIVGRVSIRHELNDFLARIGGHVGYGVVPSFRGRGYATQMLWLAFPVARSLGITRLLITCDDGNIASSRVIEKNGGVFEGKVEGPDLTIPKRRYWIDLSRGNDPLPRPETQAKR